MTATTPPFVGLLRGSGEPEGEYALRYERQSWSMLRVLWDQSERRPNHEWLVCDDQSRITFSEAWTLVQKIGFAISRDVGSGSDVALLLRNQIEFMPAFYGAQLNSGVVVPFNAESRGKHLEYLLEKSDASVLIVRDELFVRLNDLETLGGVRLVIVTGREPDCWQMLGVPVVGWETWLAEIDIGNYAVAEAALPNWHDTAVIQFTSGTTGGAKGVVFSHLYLYKAAAVVADSLGRVSSDVLFTPLPIFHVGALHFIANSALHAGCTAHVVSTFSPSKCWQQAADSGANFARILAPMLALIDKVTHEVSPHCVIGVFVFHGPSTRTIRTTIRRQTVVASIWDDRGTPSPSTPKSFAEQADRDTRSAGAMV